MIPSCGRREVPTRYLTRVWPEDDQPPHPSPSEMWCPESQAEGEAANDYAMIDVIHAWAQQRADAEARTYSYEVRRYATVGSLDPSVRTRQLVCPLASGTVRPGERAPSAAPPAPSGSPAHAAL